MLVARSRSQQVIDQVRVSLVNDLKVGAFSFTEQEVVIPVNGIPLTVVRRYDSLHLTKANFGWCWTMSVNDVDAALDEERMPQEVLAFNGMSDNDGSYTEFSLRTGGGPRKYVVGGPVAQSVTIANGITAKLVVHGGKVTTFFPEAGPGGIYAAELLKAVS